MVNNVCFRPRPTKGVINMGGWLILKSPLCIDQDEVHKLLSVKAEWNPSLHIVIIDLAI